MYIPKPSMAQPVFESTPKLRPMYMAIDMRTEPSTRFALVGPDWNISRPESVLPPVFFRYLIYASSRPGQLLRKLLFAERPSM